ncbi:putative Amino acid transporter [Leptomonas seymouri]|uniref:Putative Amino acid transporter n=1 Tax=Leptomonas seymouri TaxID=5684 RepID=A0A0N1I8K7_LEPSE|nr:putative Amino acid transporter [Leptomonas seymouri]|eukprot:KPI90305.1 putative Amino acid transporter [Leptomonas seymouri]
MRTPSTSPDESKPAREQRGEGTLTIEAPQQCNGALEDSLIQQSSIINKQIIPFDVLDESPTTPTTVNVPKKRHWYTPVFNVTASVVPYGGLLSNCFSLGSVTLGGGIISMPHSFSTSGIAMAIIYLVVITTLTVYSITLMGFAIRKTGARTFEEMGDIVFGKGWGYVVGFVLALSCTGTAIAYVSAAGTLMAPILEQSPHTPAYLKTRNGNRLIVMLIWLCLLLPVVIPKRINSIRYVAVVGCTMVLYFVITIIVHSCTNGLKQGMRGNMKYFTTGNQAIYGLSIFVFAYMCQGPVFSLSHEMTPHFSIRQLTIASAISMTVCMLFYIMAGTFGYFDFADETQGSILYNFDPVHQPYMMVAYIGMLIKICAAFAVNMIPIRNFLYACLRWDLDTTPYWRHSLLIFAIAGVVLLAGLFIPSVNLAFGLVGSLCGGFIGFIFPAYFWMFSGGWSLQTVGIWHWLATYLLIVCGVIAIVFGTIATIYSSFIDES